MLALSLRSTATKGTCVENECCHTAGVLVRRLRSLSARARSAGVIAPCSRSQSERNAASASVRRRVAAASASQVERGRPASEAAVRTASPRLAANETLILLTATRLAYPGSYCGAKVWGVPMESRIWSQVLRSRSFSRR